jgi:hypothetical protein
MELTSQHGNGIGRMKARSKIGCRTSTGLYYSSPAIGSRARVVDVVAAIELANAPQSRYADVTTE